VRIAFLTASGNSKRPKHPLEAAAIAEDGDQGIAQPPALSLLSFMAGAGPPAKPPNAQARRAVLPVVRSGQTAPAPQPSTEETASVDHRKQAIEELEVVLAEDPGDAQVHLLLGGAFGDRGLVK
jgi:hypothetical protein